MTFSIIGHCHHSGNIGVASTTVSLAVGGLCPFYSAEGDIVISQAYANRKLGLETLRLVNAGRSNVTILEEVRALDNDFEYRQLAIVRRDGAMICHSGSTCRSWAGHIEGHNCIAFGNALAGEHVVTAMTEAFAAAAHESLSERLMRALEAGRDAGGQVATEGLHFDERSAYLKEYGEDSDPAIAPIDLRVDICPQAVTELRRLFDIFTSVPSYNRLRGTRPDETPAIHQWEAEHLAHNPPPAPFG